MAKEKIPVYDILFTKGSGSHQIDFTRFKVKLFQIYFMIPGQVHSWHFEGETDGYITLLRTFRRLIDSHYRDIRLPKEYADLLYITPNHLNALCQDLLGKTAGELIRDRTLLEAKRLLTNAKMTATEIAYELNFKDNSYFNRFFKKNAGMTPDDFRQSFLHNKIK